MKGTYFFTGNMTEFFPTLTSSDPDYDYRWTTYKFSQFPQLMKMKEVGVNVVVAPYYGNWPSHPRAHDGTEEGYLDLLTWSNVAGLQVLPALEYSENCAFGPSNDEYGLSGTLGAWDHCAPNSGVELRFEQQGIITHTAAFVSRIRKLVDLFLRRPGATKNWAQIFDRNGVARYAIHISHAAQLKGTHADNAQTVANKLQEVASQIERLEGGIKIGFTLDAWTDHDVPEEGKYYVNITPGSPPTQIAEFLALQNFATEIGLFGTAHQFACQDKTNRVIAHEVTTRHGSSVRYSIFVNNYSHLVKGIADGKKSFLQSWVNSGVPVYLDVGPGYDASVVFAPRDEVTAWYGPGYASVCAGGKDGTWPGILFGDTGRTPTPVFDRWRNAQSEFKGRGIKGIVFNSWNGYTEGMVAQDTLEHGDVERRWLTDVLRADPRLCDHHYYDGGIKRHHVYGAICVKYGDPAVGGEYGVLGPPVGGAVAAAHDGIYQQPFAYGRIYWNGALATEVHGAIYSKFSSMGFDGGYGYPITDQRSMPGNPVRQFSDFYGGGSIYYSEAGTFAVYGSINQKYKAIHMDVGCGAPRSDELPYGTNGRIVYFQRGYIYWYPATGAVAVCSFG